MRFITTLIFMMMIESVIATSIAALQVPVDLAAWSQIGPSSNGDWNVAADGKSVMQTYNEKPTIFASPDAFSDKRIIGRVSVPEEDDDWFGFVFGLKNQNDFYVLDWRQGTQIKAIPGFVFAHVTGGLNVIPWERHQQSSQKYEVLWTLSNVAWQDNQTYEFTMDYTATALHVDIKMIVGNRANDVLNFSIAGDFPEGRFGFFGFSQKNVTYQRVVTENICSGSPIQPLIVNLFTDNVRIEELQTQRNPMILKIACSDMESVQRVVRPPSSATLTEQKADLRFEMDNAGAISAISLANVEQGLRIATIINADLSNVHTGMLNNLTYQPLQPRDRVVFPLSDVIVFRTKLEDFFALQLESRRSIHSITLLSKHFGSCPIDTLPTLPTPNVSEVPEPSSWLLLGSGILGLLAASRHIRKKYEHDRKIYFRRKI